ncbi:bifunctional C-5 cytosine methyltransferase/S-adenosyl-L-methionine-dependent methyltransferase superfamily [Babesia duncani]|uniref:Bifunctional C-5 cytosine methyltransferase/S-adenosyl-L-methionine-dependent methyltransferase superfamily n=1 Tax=Babesia duncani TaxID=323732 RepID=A0AAD9UMX3_9APIC|nr:bifunctional C-5 cytosine methyltransferase/S-adenosyl-L-methionine-dependent methyltransferase superfamily [Babesia duncani]
MDINVLDLFSGIGGIKFALAYALEALEKGNGCINVKRTIVSSIDINHRANAMLQLNIPCFKPNKIIQHGPVMAIDVNNINVNFFQNKPTFHLMALSPPCQPYSRRKVTQGKLQVAKDDPRRLPIQVLTKVIDKLPQELLPLFIFLENVENFLYSQDCDGFINTVKSRGYRLVAVHASPIDLGFPNKRNRLFIIANRIGKFPSYFDTGKYLYKITKELFNQSSLLNPPLVSFMDEKNDIPTSPLCIPRDVLAKSTSLAFDIVDKNDPNAISCCFTKNYGRYINGTGSVYYFGDVIDFSTIENNLELLHGRIRYFSPMEIAKLMGYRFCQKGRDYGNPLSNVAHLQHCCSLFAFNTHTLSPQVACKCPTLVLPREMLDNELFALLGNSVNPQIVATILLATNTIQQLYHNDNTVT